jgi:Fur family transcriptional regulator, ferric uptake regulator
MERPAQDALDAALRSRGMRSTPQRRTVLEAVHALGHATPEQVCASVRRHDPGVSLSTVYRTLEVLEELDLVTHAHLEHRAPTYHPAVHADHLHLVCRRCGAVQEAPLQDAATMVDSLHARFGFRTDVRHLAVHGECAGCAAAEPADPLPDPRPAADATAERSPT